VQRKKRVGGREGGAIWQKVKGIVERQRTAIARNTESTSQPWLSQTPP